MSHCPLLSVLYQKTVYVSVIMHALTDVESTYRMPCILLQCPVSISAGQCKGRRIPAVYNSIDFLSW